MKETMKVSSKSNPNALAGAIANLIRSERSACLQAVGAGSLNQAIKAIAIARGFVTASGIDLVCIPSFSEVIIEGVAKTSIKLLVEIK